jgi:hypothetical protein
MDDATKELCYQVKLAVIKTIWQMPNEKVLVQMLEFIEKVMKEIDNDIRSGRNTETETDQR